VAQHIAAMLQSDIIDPTKHLSALERFSDWLAAWPPERKRLLPSAIRMLEQSCPIPGLWDRVGVVNEALEAEPCDAPDIDQVLERLSDMQMTPREWSNYWEKEGWNRFPGETRLVALARQWLVEAAPDPSWPFVWRPLFLYFPEDRQFLELAL